MNKKTQLKLAATILIFGFVLLGAAYWRLVVVPKQLVRSGRQFLSAFEPEVANDSRFQEIQFHGVSLDGIGGLPYIPVWGSVKSQEDWEAFTNLVFEAHPPIRLTVKTIDIKPDQGEERPPRIGPASIAQNLASESAWAMTTNDFVRAQTLAAEATRLKPDFAEAWVGYGMASIKLGQTNRAWEAYERALSLQKARQLANPGDPNPVVQQIFLLSLLERSDEAKTLLKQARSEFPDYSQLKMLEENFDEVMEEWP